MAEALAALHAVKTSKGIRCQDIILLGDARQIVNVIKATDTNWSSYGHIVNAIKLKLRQL